MPQTITLPDGTVVTVPTEDEIAAGDTSYAPWNVQGGVYASAQGVNPDVRRQLEALGNPLTPQNIVDEYNRILWQETRNNQPLQSLFTDFYANRGLTGSGSHYNIGLPILQQLYQGGYAPAYDPLFQPVPTSGGGGTPTGGGTGIPTGGGSLAPSTPNSLLPAPAVQEQLLSGQPGPFNYPSFRAPSFDVPPFVAPPPFQYDEFAPPSADWVLQNSPAYDLRQREGIRALENAASAQGLLRSGQTWRALTDYASNLAGQEYEQAYGRQFNSWLANRQAAADDYDRLWRQSLTEYMLPYQAETDEFTRALQGYDANFRTAAARQGFGLDASGQQISALLGAGQLGLSQQGQLFDTLLGLYNASRPYFPPPTPTATYAF